MPNPAVYLRCVAFRTRRYAAFEVFSPSIALNLTQSVTADAAAAAFAGADVGPSDVHIAQLQDTESGAEIMHLAETGLCRHGEQEELIQQGAFECDGRLPVNTDGGCYEVALQLRGTAGPRQIPTKPTVGFTHVYGAPGVSACTVLTV
jgi:hypothetical protein